jgi:beta-lactamase regulating signal transducer with metallopeptidase domain
MLNSVVNWVNRAGALHWDFASAMFVQTVALVAVIFLVELCLRRRARAVVRYWLWALVMLKLMLPVTLCTPASVAYWIVKEPVVVAQAPTAPVGETIPAGPSTSPDSTVQPPEARNETPTVAFGPPTFPAQRSQTPIRNSQRISVAVAAQAKLATLTGSGWLLVAWCVGCLLLGVVVVRRAVKVWQLVRRAGEAPPQLDEPLQVACALLDLSDQRIRLKISDEVGCPAICGFWRPTILIPRRLVGSLDEQQFELVIVHELSHWKRWDLQLNLLQTVLQIVYFYNPAVWFANAVLRRLREEAVDDAVLIAAGDPTERYSNTLLAVASRSLHPVESNVPLIGILESRKALVRRIYRLAIGPLPSSARLGLSGFLAVALIGMALVPMAGRRRTASDIDVASVKPGKENRAKPGEPLRGRITDENGKPVADARLQLIRISGGQVQQTRTADDGSYVFERRSNLGPHRLLIASQRCIGFTDPNDGPRVVLDARKTVVRDFTLKTACQLRIQTLDGEGHPIPGVRFATDGPANFEQKETDLQGWTAIGGLRPAEYVFVAIHDGFAMAKLAVKLESPKQAVARKLVLERGVAVKGSVLCWDGKPPAGLRVVALPSWWSGPDRPAGTIVQKDGAFELPHVGPGTYNVSIVTAPAAGRGSPTRLLSGVELANQHGCLALRASFPSPGSACALQGHLRFIGGRPKQPIGVYADSVDDYRYHQTGETRNDTFHLGAVPPGRYRLRFASPEIETKETDPIAVPADDLQVAIQLLGPIMLSGRVVAESDKDPRPIGDFQIRALKWTSLSETNGPPARLPWRRIQDPQGEFTRRLPGPGVYVVEAKADGFAASRSEPIDTRHLPQGGIRLTLSKGARLTGTVVDDEGRPVDGAVVISLARANGHLPASSDSIPEGIGVKTVNGRFQFDGLTPGIDTFRIDHPEYASAAAENVKLALAGQSPLAIVLKRGATVSGHVCDDGGQPLQGVSLSFEKLGPTFEGDLGRGRIATAVTDENGYYEIRHLPEVLTQISRGQGAQSPGVICQCVLPNHAKKRTVDFGGPSKVSGQLLVNGAPLAATKLRLQDVDFNNDGFAATTVTNSQGAFVFSGIPAGKRDLYFLAHGRSRNAENWIHGRALEIHAAAQNFGRIDHRVARLTVNVAGILHRPDENPGVYLHDYNPSLFRRHFVARPNFPHPLGTEFVFENVGLGKYDVSASGEGMLRVNRMIDISADDLNPAVTLEWPHGTASLRGTIDRDLCRLLGNGWIEMATSDVRWSARLPLKDDGRFELSGIPAGAYSLTMLPVRLTTIVPVSLAAIRLRDGEVKTLTINKEDIPQAELSRGVLKVNVFTSEGIPLPGADVRLTGASGVLQPNLSRAAHSFFVALPGAYQLSAAYRGADTVARAVEIKPALENGLWKPQDHEVDVTLDHME